MSNVSVGDQFLVQTEFQADSTSHLLPSISVPAGKILEITYIGVSGVNNCKVSDYSGEYFVSEYELSNFCTPYASIDDLLSRQISMPKCDCGATKVYGENIGPEIHAHYCSLKSQQLNT